MAGNGLVPRERYAYLLKHLEKSPNVKIFTGVRRCGKSSLMKMVADSVESGANVIWIDLENMRNVDIVDAEGLHSEIKRLSKEGRNALFIDEVQEVAGWENVVRSLLKEGGYNIYLSGSNSGTLSSELATRMAGRYVSIRVSPLSLGECARFNEHYGICDPDDVFERYLLYGGMPALWTHQLPLDIAYITLKDLYETIVVRDVMPRSPGCGEIFRRMVLFICDNIGSMTSLNRMYNVISDEFDGIGGKNRFYAYAEHLENAYFIERARVFDIRGKKLLKPRYKFYLTDLGFKHMMMGYTERDVGKHLENIVFLELRNRGYDVYVGEIDGREVDFVGIRGGDRVYVQCAYVLTEDNMDREFGNLEKIPDQYPKFLVTMDERFGDGTDSGIRYMHARKFLVSDSF
ncbi:MAG: ATP-binding protein [Thermoplasmatales archaeon]|nr:ATP-binding protein [Thermoplasmatales archaeon]